ncbi:MAG: YidC/Oxa1 family membrane protein insertase [Patescibacteria group bacterium]|nr:YidC/Oxa1 family membrane protein insertase [Patescibacteria group bacterium]
MDFLSVFWFSYLYQPLFNALIWIYSNISGQNLGWAVVWLTVFLRIALLPFTIISERDSVKKQKLEELACESAKIFKNDPVAQKEEMRRIMNKYRISPWAKVITLGVQFLVLLLLYQVFMRGITGDKVIKILYHGIDYPGVINTDFYGFNIGLVHNYIWAGIVALYLFIYIVLSNRSKKWDGPSATFAFIFPLFTFIVLWWLPMVKSIFILTSMIFSDIIGLMRLILYPAKPNCEIKKITK